jgi:flagellar basal body-associated protein FliL
MKKILTISAIILLVGAAVTIAIFANKNSSQKAQIAQLTEQCKTQAALIEKLGALDAVHCEISFVVNNKAVFGSVKNGDYSQMADATLKYLRSELVQSDTLLISKNLNK